jgi:hypothetical protein
VKNLKHSALKFRLLVALGVVLVSTFGAGFGFLDSQVLKADTTAQEGLQISPFLIDINVAKGQVSSVQEVVIQNNTDEAKKLTVEVKDFEPGANGQPDFTLNSQEGDNKTFSLANWVEFIDLGPGQSGDKTNSRFELKPGGKKAIKFTINPPKDAEEGTHYASVVFRSAPTEGESSTVNSAQAIGAIVLVKYGEALESGEASASIEFKNTGNVHLKPKGEVQVVDMFGRVAKTLYINKDGANVLPKSSRNFQSVWEFGDFTIGRYKLVSKITFGDAKQEIYTEKVIWVLSASILALLLGMIFGFCLIFFVILPKYKKFVLRNSHKS